jgi:NTP pyrophosphatase (non-canonical NTP hydrolase)
MELSEYQRLAQATDKEALDRGDNALIVPLLGLAGETGTLLSSYKKWLRDGQRHRLFTEKISEDLGDILWYLANLAEKFGISLDDVAKQNLVKTADRFSDVEAAARQHSFDLSFPPNERLPERFEVSFDDESTEGPHILRVLLNGSQVGDFLTDNAYREDGYRYHDAFHFAYATMLGWSPVTRRNFHCKRKSSPTVDNVEDGGRARVFEESIAALVFERAQHHDYYENVDSVDYDILRTIKGLVSNQEVRIRTARDWEEAILEGFRIWRLLTKYGGGRVSCDLITRTMEFSPHPAED